MFEIVEENRLGARIKAVGVGGGGGNAINTMIGDKIAGVSFIVANTDAQALEASNADVKVQLGEKITKGLGAGADPEIGRQAALNEQDRLREYLAGSDMVFITAGMGGGTGTGGAPVIAKVAQEEGCLTVGVVTKPFAFEGKRRMCQAEEGILKLKENVDTLIVIPNQRLLSIAEKDTPLNETFKMADSVLLQAVRGISDLIVTPGLINLDFADVRTVMSEMGFAMMGSSSASGDNRALEAAQKAISSPLLEDISISGARGVLINITGSSDLSLCEVSEAATMIQEVAHEEANIIFGAVIDEATKDEIRITVIATGFGEMEKNRGKKNVIDIGASVGSRDNNASSKKVVHLGRIDDISGMLDVPTYKRVKNNDKGTEPTHTEEKSLESKDNDGEDEIDIPTFLRKKMD